MAFNIQAAIQAGYSPQEIQAHLQQQANQPKAPILNGAMQLGGSLLGQAVGGDVGAAAGALVPGLGETGISEGAGAYGGGVVGGGIGSGIGNAGADWIRQNLLGDKTINSGQTLNNSIDAAKQGAVATAAGIPIAKGLGILAHPISSVMQGDVPFIKGVSNILSKSSKNINVSDIGGVLDNFRTNELPKFYAKGVGPEAEAAYNTVSRRVQGMVDSIMPPVEGVNPSATQIAGKANITSVPVKVANTIKQNLSGLVKDLYGEMGNTETQVTKGVSSAFKTAVATAEPGVKPANAIAHALYTAPDLVSGLSQILSLGNPAGARALQSVANLPGGIIGKAIPQGGGYLNQAIPRFIQSLLQANQAQNQQGQ